MEKLVHGIHKFQAEYFRPRHELFVYVEDVDGAVERVPGAGGAVLKPPADMPWGERVGYVADPEENVVSLATAAG